MASGIGEGSKLEDEEVVNSVLMDSSTHLSTLSNGIKVASQAITGELCSFMVLVNAGRFIFLLILLLLTYDHEKELYLFFV